MTQTLVASVVDVPRVVIVAEHASFQFGGEAALPLHYFVGLRKRGIEAWIVVHIRTKDELLETLPNEIDRMHFTQDTWINRAAWRLSRFLPSQISVFSTGFISRLTTQFTARRIARDLVRQHGATVVHQPIPVSPREPSVLYRMGAAVVIGPMNGNMTYPPAFRRSVRGQALIGRIIAAGRMLSRPMHTLLQGKLQADLLLVANERTRVALPSGLRGEVIELVENGVDLDLWRARAPMAQKEDTRPVRFVFMGRLIDLKRVDVMIEAVSRMTEKLAIVDIIGDGDQRQSLEALVHDLGLSHRINFIGWLSQAECSAHLAQADALVLPSIHECGGAVVLEAMSCGLPAIATNWGGPADYIVPQSGILIAPTSREAMVAGFADAMDRLARDPELRDEMGREGRRLIENEYSWARKIDRILELYAIASERYLAR